MWCLPSSCLRFISENTRRISIMFGIGSCVYIISLEMNLILSRTGHVETLVFVKLKLNFIVVDLCMYVCMYVCM
jgi:hypothetical protein